MILEQRVKGLIKGLERGKGELEGLVKSGREVVKGIEKVQEGEWLLRTRVIWGGCQDDVALG